MPTGRPNGRPRKQASVPTKPKKSAKPAAPVYNLTTYEGLSAASDLVLAQQIQNANDQVDWYKSRLDAIVAGGGKIDAGELGNIESNFNKALKLQADLWDKLRKQCDLYEEKKAGRENDPLYTPFHIHVQYPTTDRIAPQAYAPPDEDPSNGD